MDVELQILKHLPRDAQPTVSFIDEYCSGYKDLFREVRGYECFKYLHLGIILPIKRKSLPEIAKVVGINSAQSLANFLYNTNTGLLKFDRNGTGASAALAIATLAGSPLLDASQFTITA